MFQNCWFPRCFSANQQICSILEEFGGSLILRHTHLFHFVSSCESLARRLQFSVFEQPKCQIATALTDDMKSRFLSHSWKQLQVCHIFRNPSHYLAGLPQSLQFCCSKFVETDPFCFELKNIFLQGDIFAAFELSKLSP